MEISYDIGSIETHNTDKVVASEIKDLVQWDNLINSLQGNPLQLSNWGKLKAQSSWSVNNIVITNTNHETFAAAQILTRKLPAGLGRISHIPRGPVFADFVLQNPFLLSTILGEIINWVTENLKSIAIIAEPDYSENKFSFTKFISEEFPEEYSRNWLPSQTPILFNKTLIIDLTQSQDTIFAGASKKNLQHLRESDNIGVKISIAQNIDDVKKVLGVYKEVASRAKFALHSDDYFYQAFKLGIGPLYIATLKDEVVSFLWLAQSKSTAFELWGGANALGQANYANTAVKWFAIKDMKAKAIQRYDMNGLLNDGISNYKRSFAKKEDILVPSHTVALSPKYHLYVKAYKSLKLLKKVFN
ncbi:MAG: peptidoglycan bridge formation glycyltransferase FemA/FemB family protein [Bifidobacteriaceae bacterium]|jgi:lipid II:glycine glycyltransferase (peptidoglycan interpeptide bridge formation enzyme)|nr:peptidoglycan bridge formation glycyltransferase FemA/FemB family protein [Bifidobacteriaceae bacterium]